MGVYQGQNSASALNKEDGQHVCRQTRAGTWNQAGSLILHNLMVPHEYLWAVTILVVGALWELRHRAGTTSPFDTAPAWHAPRSSYLKRFAKASWVVLHKICEGRWRGVWCAPRCGARSHREANWVDVEWAHYVISERWSQRGIKMFQTNITPRAPGQE